MENVPFFPSADNSKPLHSWLQEQQQYRLKVRTFTKAPPEFTVQRISFEKDFDRYHSAYERGQTRCGTPGGGKRRTGGQSRDPESIERSARRAKINLRLRVTELAPNHFVTFTTRETGSTYFTPDDWLLMWGYFVALLRTAGHQFEYVAVLERHPSNPLHLHLHVAWRGNVNYKLLRRFWHIAICKQKGERVTKTLYGSESPGNVQDKPVKAPRGSFKQIRKIARYISKYMTKDAITAFNRKSYFSSKGIDLEAAKTYWLDSIDYVDAVREACMMLGQWDDLNGCAQKMFMPSDRIAWCAIDPERTPPPPF